MTRKAERGPHEGKPRGGKRRSWGVSDSEKKHLKLKGYTRGPESLVSVLCFNILTWGGGGKSRKKPVTFGRTTQKLLHSRVRLKNNNRTKCGPCSQYTSKRSGRKKKGRNGRMMRPLGEAKNERKKNHWNTPITVDRW